MDHGQLAEDYRLKLKTANDRVFELEGTIADLAYQLDQLTAAPHDATKKLEAANARITELEEAVMEAEARREDAMLNVDEEGDSVLQRELDGMRDHVQELKEQLAHREKLENMHDCNQGLQEQLVRCQDELAKREEELMKREEEFVRREEKLARREEDDEAMCMDPPCCKRDQDAAGAE